MRVTPLAARSSAGARDALLSHGWEGASAGEAAAGMESAALHLQDVSPEASEALVQVAGRLGLEVLTGDGWALLAGARSRLTAFARPWQLPPVLAQLAVAVARALPADLPAAWRTATGIIRLDRPAILGILNLSLDSFSDGGLLPTTEVAVAHAAQLLAGGATMFDVGAQSTRPGVPAEVPLQEELDRVIPSVRALRREYPDVPISVDTVRADVAEAALEAGAAAINDVSGLRLDPQLGVVVARAGAGLVLMHSRGGVTEMANYTHAVYDDVVGDVVGELRQAMERAADAGVPADHLVVDPGFGFAKTPEQSWRLARELPALRCLGRPLLVGPSRKRFLGEATGRDVSDRDRATAAWCALAWSGGARLFRVHDPAAVRDALAVAVAQDPPSPAEQ